MPAASKVNHTDYSRKHRGYNRTQRGIVENIASNLERLEERTIMMNDSMDRQKHALGDNESLQLERERGVLLSSYTHFMSVFTTMLLENLDKIDRGEIAIELPALEEATDD